MTGQDFTNKNKIFIEFSLTTLPNQTKAVPLRKFLVELSNNKVFCQNLNLNLVTQHSLLSSKEYMFQNCFLRPMITETCS